MKKTIKSYEDACKALGIDAKALPDVTMLPKKHQKAFIAHYKLIIIAEALNEGWKPNWDDYNELKYYPWFRVNASAKNTSGSGLSFDVFGCTYAGTGVGARLCFQSRELAKYAGTKFIKLYQEYLLLK